MKFLKLKNSRINRNKD